MMSDELDHKGLLELDPLGGEIRFAGQRAVLLDAVAKSPCPAAEYKGLSGQMDWVMKLFMAVEERRS